VRRIHGGWARSGTTNAVVRGARRGGCGWARHVRWQGEERRGDYEWLTVLDDMLCRGCASDVVTYNILLEVACSARGY
jgi:hypothetical protein